MKRKERVYQAVRAFSQQKMAARPFDEAGVLGLTAHQVAEVLGIERSNASRDLNRLHAEKRLIKVAGKPVLFLDWETLGNLAPNHYLKDILTLRELEELLQEVKPTSSASLLEPTLKETTGLSPLSSPAGLARSSALSHQESMTETALDRLIGAQGSLKTQVQQAKAAILYPPHGLHTLLLGATGVGKTSFAGLMHLFAVEMSRFPASAPFISFNCADYANNPQLLLSQLFGHCRGAFTGAEKDKAGLVEKADGGILFLDEVHRLPPEGQEMLFHLMDKGVFRRLGESDRDRRARVLVIAATTENPEVVLLKTFYRRIPMVINIHPLQERPLAERLEMIRTFFREEAGRTGVEIAVSVEALRALLLYDCPGNAGQLKNDVQLSCARGFLEYISKPGRDMGSVVSYSALSPWKRVGGLPSREGREAGSKIKITLSSLPDHVRRGIFKIDHQRREIDRLLDLSEKEMVVSAGDLGCFAGAPGDSALSDSFYEMIERQMVELKRQGLTESEINKVISVDIELYFRKSMERFADKQKTQAEEIRKIVGQEVLHAVQEMVALAESRLEKEFHLRFFYGLAMHLSTTLERLRQGKAIINPHLQQIRLSHPREFLVATEMIQLVEKELGIRLPLDEAGFIAMFLHWADRRREEEADTVGVIVLAHGYSAAGTMAEVANRLLGANHARAIDMPLDESPEAVLDRLENMIREVNQGKGVLLLVDMGSLLTFGEIITRRTGIPTRTIEMVSTPMVIEAVRKAIQPNSDLDSVAQGVLEMSPYLGRLVADLWKKGLSLEKKKILLTVCITGEGSAVKLKGLVEGALPFLGEAGIGVIPFGLSGKGDGELRALIGQQEVLAVVGTVDPKLADVPFIPIEEILWQQGIDRLRRLVQERVQGTARTEREKKLPAETETASRRAIFDQITITLTNHLRFINPRMVVEAASEMMAEIEGKLATVHDNNILIGLLMHLACSVEKLIRNPAAVPQCPEKEEIKVEFAWEWRAVKEAARKIEERFDVRLPEEEIGNIVKILKQVSWLEATVRM